MVELLAQNSDRPDIFDQGRAFQYSDPPETRHQQQQQ